MRWSQLFIPTLRETPADAEVPSHQLLLRAGYIRPLSAGVYSYLYLGQRSMLKIMEIIREEMNAIGAQEFYLPALHPAELWQETGRWELMAENMFQLKDHAGRNLCLGMTHEEVMADIARRELQSYKQLPQIWYQIQVKFRDEARPKGGLMRLRQFIMKDSYSFDLDEAGLDASYWKHHGAYSKVFDRCGLKYLIVEAHTGAMGGATSHEFVVPSAAGEEPIATCACGYAATLDKARGRVAAVRDLDANRAPEPFDTPNIRTIDELVRFTGTGPEHMMKALCYMADGQMTLALVRGDDELNEAKFSDALGGAPFRPAHPEEIRASFGAEPGFIGAVGAKNVRVLADEALHGRKNLIAGANHDHTHLRYVTPGKDFEASYADLRNVKPGDGCLNCDGTLTVQESIEVGQIFKLGRRYAEALGARVLGADGKEVTLIMGSYGIGVERILTAAIEQNHDEDGMFLPLAIAPFAIVLTPVNLNEPETKRAAEQIYVECRAQGLDVLFDDRDERPGVKFKDADLIGVPYRVTVGRKAAEGVVEIVERSTRQSVDVRIAEVAASLKARVTSSVEGGGRS